MYSVKVIQGCLVTVVIGLVIYKVLLIGVHGFTDRELDFPFFRFYDTVSKLFSIDQVFDDQYKEKPIFDTGRGIEIVVLFIGESARGDHFGINGYTRNTSPNISKIPNLFSFKDSVPCRMSTSLSTTCLLTGYNAPVYMQWPRRTSLISYYYNAGYDIYFISTGAQDILEQLSSEAKLFKKTLLSKNALMQNFSLNYDDRLEYFLDLVLNDGGVKPKFILINGIGAHFDQENKVSKRYYNTMSKLPLSKNADINYLQSKAPFCSLYGNRSYKKVVDWYDAVILHTDRLISRMILKLRDKEALFVYASDHGESFGDDGRPCLHGYNSSEIWNIPFLLWFSKKYQVKNPRQVNAIIKNYAGINRNIIPKLSHDNIFSSLLDCSGITSDAINLHYSLCRNVMEPTLALSKCSRFQNDETAKGFCFYENYQRYQ